MVTRFVRYGQIVDVLVKYGFGIFLKEIFPGIRRFRLSRRATDDSLSMYVRVRMAIEELGPTFVKFGQIMSTRQDLLPDPLIHELETLQDHTNPLPFDQVVGVLRECLPGYENIFQEIDEEPVASASLSQVHRAVLKDGTIVALKIQRPGIEGIIETDISILESLAARVERAYPSARIYNPTGIVQSFASQIRKELDFIKDGKNADRFRKNFKDIEGIRFPKIYWAYSCRRLLVMEFIEGTKITSTDELQKMGINLKKISETGFEAYLKQIFEDGFFHGDPHPGNLMVTRNGDLVFLDFGLIGVLRPEKRFIFLRLLQGIVDQDADMVLSAFENLGVEMREEDRESIRDEIYVALIDSEGFTLDSNSFSYVVDDLTDVLRRYHLKVPTSLMLMLKVIIMIVDIGIKLDPEFNFKERIQPFIAEMALKMDLPHHLIRQAKRSAIEGADGIFDLPRNINRSLKKLATGTFAVEIVETDVVKLQDSFDRSSDKLLVGIITGSVVIGSSIILMTMDIRIPDFIGILAILGYSAAMIIGFYALYHVLAPRIR